MKQKFGRFKFPAAFFLLLAVSRPLIAQTPTAADTVKSEMDVIYGEAGGQKQKLDIFSPVNVTSARPAILYIHGGGWSGGDKSAYRSWATQLTKAGYVCFWANYRLVTKEGNKYPAQIDDAQRAVRWIRAHATQYHIDPNRIGAIGDSAGGHLVALLGTRDTRDNSDTELAKYSSKVNCVVDLYGPADFTLPSRGVSDVAKGIVINFLGKTPEQAPDLYKEVSPITYVDKTSVPFLIFHGDKDPLVPLDQSRRLFDALRKAGVAATFVIMPDDGHGFQKKDNQERFMKETLDFFKRHLRP